ncbi:MAG TPA: lamin tail domain-containing protein, partial [Bacteroidia bacterium]|nr:lamin tail domain-containing protein [Bacteroidia bacterium]
MNKFYFNVSRTISVLVIFLILFLTSVSKAQIVINELQTSNLTTIQDEYLQYDDWVELYNAGGAAVNLNGYGLSDDSTNYFRFRFPSISIPSGGYLLVFASDTDKTSVNTHWETAVNENDSWKYRVNTSAPPDTNWRNVSFNDGTWSSGTGGIGFGDSDDGTTVSTCISVYTRKTFSISDTSKIFEAVLNADYDDGFVAYLNGVEIARVNTGIAGIRPAWNDLAPASREAVMYSGGVADSFYLSKNLLKSLLKNGTNVLAIEVHNNLSTSTDL